MASAAELGEARAKQVRAITLDRAKDVLKERQREKKLVDKWSKEYITVRHLLTQGWYTRTDSWRSLTPSACVFLTMDYASPRIHTLEPLSVHMQIRLLTEDGEELDGCTWQIQRAKLTPQFLQVSGSPTSVHSCI
jgi:hypothetical protein